MGIQVEEKCAYTQVQYLNPEETVLSAKSVSLDTPGILKKYKLTLNASVVEDMDALPNSNSASEVFDANEIIA